MELQLSLVVFSLLSVCSKTSEDRSTNNSHHKGIKKVRWINPIANTIENCEKWCTQNEDCRPSSMLIAVLSCKLRGNVMADIVIRRQNGQRTAHVTVLNRVAWKICSSLVESVTSVCKSLSKVSHKANAKARHKANPKARHKANPKARHKANPKARHKANPKAKHEADAEKVRGPNRKPLRRYPNRRILLTAVTASSRYKDIVYGLALHVKLNTPFLSFNVTNKFAFHEQSLVSFIAKKSKTATLACGLTAGPCFTGEGYCAYMCYKFEETRTSLYKVCMFDEPDIDQKRKHIRCSYFDLAKGRLIIKSIALSKDLIFYSLEYHMRLVKIRALRISARPDGYISAKEIKETLTLFKPTFLGLIQEQAQLLVVVNGRFHLLETSVYYQKTTVARKFLKSFHLTVRGSRLVCSLSDGSHVVVMDGTFPYRPQKIVLKRGSG